MTKHSHRRGAFTLVEMLVAAALIIFMMYIIASAFEKGLESFRILKAQGDMNEKLRAAASALRLDLSTPHFGGAMSPDNQGPYLSDQRLNNQYWQPPQKGYFRISLPGVNPTRQNGGPPAAGTGEAFDPDNPNAAYYRLMYANSSPPFCPSKDMYLQFTVNLTDGHPTVRDARGRRDQFFMTDTFDGSMTGYGKPVAPSSTQPDYTGDGTLNMYAQPTYNQNDISLHPLNKTQSGYLPTNSVYSTLYTSQWAEVAYFVLPNGRSTDAQPPLPLFDLYRRQKLLVEPSPPNPYPLPVPAQGNYADLSTWSPTIQQGSNTVTPNYFNGAANVTVPQRRWGMWAPTPTQLFPFGQPTMNMSSASVQPFPRILNETGTLNDARTGGDLLLTDVLNVEIKALWEPVRVGAANTDRFAMTVQGAVNPDFVEPSPKNNPDYPFDWLPQGINPGINAENNGQTPPPVVFDTWSCNTDAVNVTVNNTTISQTFNYGPAVTVNNATTPVKNTMMQQELGMWNVGHFNPVAGLTPVTGTQQNPYPPTPYTIPLRVRVRALQIKLRIWDQKSNQTRQITIIQDV
jgi:type II secretory pathway pseudopilin PulG